VNECGREWCIRSGGDCLCSRACLSQWSLRGRAPDQRPLLLLPAALTGVRTNETATQDTGTTHRVENEPCRLLSRHCAWLPVPEGGIARRRRR
jgi:hypothetical protein